MSIYTLAEICGILEKIEEYQLFGREITRNYLITELQKICNGAGPDSWMELSREIVTKIVRLFEPVVMIHDLDFENSDGTEETFLEVTDRWKANCRIVFDSEYPFWTLKQLSPKYRRERAYWYSVMKLANKAISGKRARAAWQAAYNRNKTISEAKGNVST